MNHEDFKKKLTKEIDNFLAAIATDSGEWIVKGFIDVYKNIYTISVDTKVISKIIELMLFPLLVNFAEKYKYKIVLSEHQNHYPDMSFVAKNGTKIALDLKSTYRTSANRANGFTLGAFTGYFRNLESSKNITFPYSEYSSHLVLGVVYNRSEETTDERKTYKISDLKKITSVIRDFEFIIQEKWKIAGEKPGSGNTKNIGSCKKLSELREGNGPFAEHGEEIFNDYWMNFLTNDMAKAIDSCPPYNNIEEYLQWKKRGNK